MFLYNTPISRILYCAKIYPGPTPELFSTERHSHALVYFMEGRGEYIYGEKAYAVQAGTLLFLPKGKQYTIRRFASTQCIYIDFLTCEDLDLGPFSKNYPNGAQFRDLFISLLSLYRQKRHGFESEMMSLLYKLISMIQVADQVSYFPGIKYQKIAAAVEYIHLHYCDGQIRIAKLAELSGVSTRYFNELFSVFFGVSPKEYIIRMQLETAKSLLLSSERPIGEIAETCGFGDVYYFSKVFRKEVGETPSAFRKANKLL